MASIVAEKTFWNIKMFEIRIKDDLSVTFVFSVKYLTGLHMINKVINRILEQVVQHHAYYYTLSPASQSIYFWNTFIFLNIASWNLHSKQYSWVFPAKALHPSPLLWSSHWASLNRDLPVWTDHAIDLREFRRRGSPTTRLLLFSKKRQDV